MSLGPAEILVVLVLALIVFGPKRLPEVGRQVGGALRELRKVQSSVEQEIRSVLDDTTGPVRSMLPGHSPEPVPDVTAAPAVPPGAGAEAAAIEASADAAVAAEPDAGDEHRTEIRPAVSAPAPAPERAAPDIEGLSGGTFN